jgi:hypothetical protein
MDTRTDADQSSQIGHLKVAWSCEHILSRRQLSGKSGDRLHLVDIRLADFDGQAILKISTNDLAPEKERQVRALELSGAFGASHFPRVIRYEKFDGWSALLMTVAGSGLLFTNLFSSINKSSFRLSAAQKINEGILNQWNSGAALAKTESTACSLLQQWLGDRIGPNSRLPSLIDELYGASGDSKGFDLYGNRFPNPFAFVMSDDARSANAKLIPICGFTHGDFHGGNVLVREYPSAPSEFYIIDFDSFEESRPLLFDNAYFELSYLLKQREDSVLDRWIPLLASLENVEETSVVTASLKDSEDHGHVWCAALMRSTVDSWGSRAFAERKEDFTKQKLLARVAVGLNFAQKTHLDSGAHKSIKLKEFAFLYAASNLRNFLRFTRLADKTAYVSVNRESKNPKSTSSSWRDVWDECDSFNEDRNAFVLICGPKLGSESDYCRSALAQIPWSLVLDFDPQSDNGRFLGSARGPLSQRRGFHLVIPGQKPAMTFAKAVCWLMADGWAERPDSIKSTLPDWRRSVVPSVRAIAQSLKLEIAPKPIKIVILGEGIEAPKLRAVCAAMEEALPGARVVVVTNGNADAAFDHIEEEVSQIRRVKCSYSDLSLGLHRMFGEIPDDGEVYTPIRDAKSGEISRLKLEPARIALLSESFELVHDGAARESDRSAEVSDFFRGNTITWRELDLGVDVPREVTAALQDQLIQRASKSRVAAFALEHTPGAGGTTVARRIAWSLRNSYPTVVLHRYIETTAELLDWLSQATNLPVLVVIERRDLSDAERDHLFRNLKGRYVRFIFLDVRRALKPREDGISTFALRDPMAASEANQFLDRYAQLAPSARQKSLKLLTIDRSHIDFRSAFFYGFYAFEDEFVRVPNFVEAHLANLTSSQREIVARLALITRYSQSRLPNACLSMLADTEIPEASDPSELLGSSTRLIVFDTTSLGIVHPAIAEEVLAQTLRGTGTPSSWRARLADFCVNFIVAVGKSPDAYGDNIKDILVQLFVERSIWDDTAQPRLFSNLIETIPTIEGQRRVLETLCNTFPSNAHFWNHLGRHLNLRIRAPFAEAERCFLHAIELEPKNEIHHHGLGMVYRFEVRSRLEKPLDRAENLSQRLESLEPVFDKAEQCFRTAHELDSESQYPLVTHIQIIIESIERVFNLSGEKKYEALINRADVIGSWCRVKLQRAESLLADLKRTQTESEQSKYTIECESKLLGLYGNFDAMVRGLTGLLGRDDVNRRAIRRLIVHCHVRHNKEDFDRIDKGTARRIADMMLENLTEDPGNGSDIRLWLRAFRMLPEFTLSEALERVSTWAVLSENIDAYYYLYVLHYVHLTRGAQSSFNEVRKHIEMCRRKAPLLISKRSFEWWASDSLGRLCPLVHHSELSGWDKNSEFWTNAGKLGYVDGIIDEIASPQAGRILASGLPTFFVPARLLSSADVNAKVKFHLGFSYEGLRAWNVQLV